MRVLITAGTVYGRLDDNKLVGNRVRGIWAGAFAEHLAARGHKVTLLLPDTSTLLRSNDPNITVVLQDGFYGYRDACLRLADRHDAAVMAAAVVNWIPKTPISGKMQTAGYKVGDTQDITFVLAPRVIEEMKGANPKLTLIGCKMLIGSTHDELINAAYGVLLKSRCNVVLANDMERGLRTKFLINKDRSVQTFDDDFNGLFKAMTEIIEDEHFSTERVPVDTGDGRFEAARKVFDDLVDTHRNRFSPVEGGRVFGSLAVQLEGAECWLTSPREKGEMFTSEDATLVVEIDLSRRTVTVPPTWNKATLNAPLLIRFGSQFGHGQVAHFHEQIEGLPTLPYAQPGTVRDNMRFIPDDCKEGFNIEGHGCFLPVDDV